MGDAGNVADPLTGYGRGGLPVLYRDVCRHYRGVRGVSQRGSDLTDPMGVYTKGMANDLPTDGIIQTSTSAGFTYSIRGRPNVPVFDVSWGDWHDS